MQSSSSLSSVDGDDIFQNVPPPPPPPSRDTDAPRTQISSLDFERVVNEYSIQATRDRLLISPEEQQVDYKNGYGTISSRETEDDLVWKKRPKTNILGYTGRTATRWALSALAGLMTGLTAILIVSASEELISLRIYQLNVMAKDRNFSNVKEYVLFAVINLVLALVSCLLCVGWVPEGAGSGIPEVKAYLNGVRVKRFSSLPLFIVKIVGTVLSVSSSLAIGMEGPLVHIGAIVGAMCTKISGILSRLLTRGPQCRATSSCCLRERWLHSLWAWTTTDLSHFATDAERRDLVSIGASCGFAASFGAPIGGLLFVLDDISSYFSKNMFLRTLVANAIGTFCLAVHHGDLSDYSVINLGTFSSPNGNIFFNRFEEVPLYVLIGIIGGAMGGVFCYCFRFLKKHISSRQFRGAKGKLVEVAILSLVTSSLLFGLPCMGWPCKNVEGSEMHMESDITKRQFFCEEGEINELAFILLGSRDVAIKRILTDPSQFQIKTLMTVGILFFFLMTLTFGTCLPSGVFMPTVLIGASLGGAAGLSFQDFIDPEITPATFALLGVAALLTGVQRSTVSLCVILVEGTGQIKVLIPVIITVIVARYVAQLIHAEGIYETAMELKGYPYLTHEEQKRYDIVQVQDIMSEPVRTIGPTERAQKLVHLLNHSTHHGFPVVDPSTNAFLGLIRRDQIAALLECGIFESPDDDETSSSGSMRPSPSWTPSPGVGKSPMMHWAYHIKDDRYDYVRRASAIMEESDEFDDHAWLLSMRTNLDSLPALNVTGMDDSESKFSVIGDDSLPPLPAANLLQAVQSRSTKNVHGGKALSRGSSRSSSHSAPTGYATVGINDSGTLVIPWLNPDYRRHRVNVSSVMNRGTYCVTEFCPVSKAHSLFALLGLRHAVVLGPSGTVVGILTRANFQSGHIRKRTGMEV